MIPELNEEQKILKKSVRAFMDQEIVPIADEYDRKYLPLPRDIAVNLLKKMAPFGYIGATLPQRYGGQDLDLVSYGILVEELGRAYAGLGVVAVMQNAALLPIVSKEGTEEQKAKFIPRVLSVEKITCFGLTEPDVGSAARDVKTTAVPDGEYFIINGTKSWISNGEIADYAVIFASTEPGRGARAISCFVVDKAESPFTARELPKMGLRSCPTSEMTFEDCRVPKSNLVGNLGDAYSMALADLVEIRVSVGIAAVGIAQAAIEAAVKYAQERKQFGRPIGSFQLVQEMIADMVMMTEAARFLCYQAYYLLNKGVTCFREASMAKAFSTEMAIGVTSKAVQIHGAYGISEEYPVERYFRDARSLTFPDGATQIQKLIIGREMLGLSAFT